VIAQHQTTIKL